MHATFAGLETIEGLALALEGVDDIQCGDSLSPCVLGVCDGVSNDTFEEVTKDATDFFVDVAADSLDAASARQTPDGRLRNSLDVFTHDLSVSLGATLSKTLSTFAASRHPK
jgi:hypothetical protein